jgi:hypothetical protein
MDTGNPIEPTPLNALKKLHPQSIVYSTFSVLTGLAIAALMAWKLTVISAIKTAPRPARTKAHQLMSTRYTKSWSQ